MYQVNAYSILTEDTTSVSSMKWIIHSTFSIRTTTAEEATRKFEAFCLCHEQSDTPKPKPGQLFLENNDLSFRFEGVNEATKRTATDFLLMFVVMFDAKMKDSIEYVFLTESWN